MHAWGDHSANRPSPTTITQWILLTTLLCFPILPPYPPSVSTSHPRHVFGLHRPSSGWQKGIGLNDNRLAPQARDKTIISDPYDLPIQGQYCFTWGARSIYIHQCIVCLLQGEDFIYRVAKCTTCPPRDSSSMSPSESVGHRPSSRSL